MKKCHRCLNEYDGRKVKFHELEILNQKIIICNNCYNKIKRINRVDLKK